MTTIVARLYESASDAERVRDALLAEGFPGKTVDVIAPGDGAADAIAASRLPDAPAQTYAEALTGQRALLVVRAPFTPFGAARKAMELAAEVPSVDVGLAKQSFHIEEQPNPELFDTQRKMRHDHIFLLEDEIKGGHAPRGFSRVLGLPLLYKRKPDADQTLLKGDPHLSTRFFPLPLLAEPRKGRRILKGNPFMSKRFLPMPMLSTGKRKSSVISGTRRFLYKPAG